VTDAAFLFADLAGFTALTETHGDEAAVTLIADFNEAVAAECRDCGAEQVKSIGDAVMLRVPDPGEAIQLGLRLVGGAMTGHGSPPIRVGLHYGPAVEREGDYFGATVNLAARVSALAAGGEVLVTGAAAALAPDLPEVFYEPRGRHELRNVRDPVEIFAARRIGAADAEGLPVDPVCQMAVDPERAAGMLRLDEASYFFCSLACAGAFAREPDRFRTSRAL
jgi:adenylate cyclase